MRSKLAESFKKLSPQLRKIDTIIDGLMEKNEVKRTKFDFVVGNPPYIKYNEIRSKLRIDITGTWPKMSDLFGINLHSVP